MKPINRHSSLLTTFPGCAEPQLATGLKLDFDYQTNFAQYKTGSWEQGSQFIPWTRESRVQSIPIVEARLTRVHSGGDVCIVAIGRP
jgi:hypothetical protein